MLQYEGAEYMHQSTELIEAVADEVRAYIEWVDARGGVVGVKFEEALSQFREEYRDSLKGAVSK